jgi:SAM-dependent methyltransferase
MRHLEARGVGEGWNCLEVGAGGGSITAWLCARVAPTGHVVATDIDTRFLDSLQRPNLTILRHDILTDELPQGAFELVCTRLVLLHLPDRERALARMVAALRPGGWLVVEDYDALSMRPDPAVNPTEVSSKTYDALHAFYATKGIDLRYGRLLPGRLRAHGLTAIGAEGRVLLWHRGSLYATLLRATSEQLRAELVAAGYVTEREFDLDLAGFGSSDLLNPTPVIWAAWGQRPEHD